MLVGVKMDSPSKELLTWALVKVAHPGDTVVALHVLGNNGRRGISTFFSFFWVFVFLMWRLIGEMRLRRNREWRREIVAAFACQGV